jgi:hypothetical protein
MRDSVKEFKNKIKMKKIIIAIVAAIFLLSCGGSTEVKPVEANYGPVGVDSSNILPELTDSAKIEFNGVKPRPELNEK